MATTEELMQRKIFVSTEHCDGEDDDTSAIIPGDDWDWRRDGRHYHWIRNRARPTTTKALESEEEGELEIILANRDEMFTSADDIAFHIESAKKWLNREDFPVTGILRDYTLQRLKELENETVVGRIRWDQNGIAYSFYNELNEVGSDELTTLETFLEKYGDTLHEKESIQLERDGCWSAYNIAPDVRNLMRLVGRFFVDDRKRIADWTAAAQNTEDAESILEKHVQRLRNLPDLADAPALTLLTMLSEEQLTALYSALDI